MLSVNTYKKKDLSSLRAKIEKRKNTDASPCIQVEKNLIFFRTLNPLLTCSNHKQGAQGKEVFL